VARLTELADHRGFVELNEPPNLAVDQGSVWTSHPMGMQMRGLFGIDIHTVPDDERADRLEELIRP
jgi:hypothetical protein